MLKRPVAAAMVLLMLMVPSLTHGENTVSDASIAPTVEDYVCNPVNTNFLFINVSGETIYPGKSGDVFFRLNNPYVRSMENVSLTAEICAWATLDHQYSEIDSSFVDPPTIKQGNGQVYHDSVGSIRPGMNVSYTLTMDTKDNTPEGTYYVRFTLEFDYSNSSTNSTRHFIMRSMSYYTKEQWEYATRNATASDIPYYRHGVNVTYLSQFYPVDAIILFTSFSVHKGVPKWPLLVFAGSSAFFAILAYMFYMNDNYGKYKWLDEKSKQVSGKYQKFRRRLYERARKK